MNDDLRQLNEQCARAMGWTCTEEDGFWPNTERVWRDKDGMKVEFPPTAQLLEDEIERRDLGEQYARTLIEQLSFAGDFATAYLLVTDLWLVIRATPEQRAQAFLKTINERAIVAPA